MARSPVGGRALCGNVIYVCLRYGLDSRRFFCSRRCRFRSPAERTGVQAAAARLDRSDKGKSDCRDSRTICFETTAASGGEAGVRVRCLTSKNYSETAHKATQMCQTHDLVPTHLKQGDVLENTSEVEVEMGGIIRYSLKHPNGLFSLPLSLSLGAVED